MILVAFSTGSKWVWEPLEDLPGAAHMVVLPQARLWHYFPFLLHCGKFPLVFLSVLLYQVGVEWAFSSAGLGVGVGVGGVTAAPYRSWMQVSDKGEIRTKHFLPPKLLACSDVLSNLKIMLTFCRNFCSCQKWHAQKPAQKAKEKF